MQNMMTQVEPVLTFPIQFPTLNAVTVIPTIFCDYLHTEYPEPLSYSV